MIEREKKACEGLTSVPCSLKVDFSILDSQKLPFKLTVMRLVVIVSRRKPHPGDAGCNSWFT